MKFPYFPKRKADTISNGVFLILIGVLFYTGQWWPGILFAIGLTYAIKQYLIGRRLPFIIAVSIIGLFGVLTLSGQIPSFVFPLIFIGLGFLMIFKECFPDRRSEWKKPSDPNHFED